MCGDILVPNSAYDSIFSQCVPIGETKAGHVHMEFRLVFEWLNHVLWVWLQGNLFKLLHRVPEKD